MSAYAWHPVVRRALHPLCEHIPPTAVGIRGHLYDVDAFASQHPGGRAWIELCKGTDATTLFELMHLNSDRADRHLAQLPRVGSYTPRHEWDFDSYRELKKLVCSRYPTMASRRGTRGSARAFALWCVAAMTAHGYLIFQRSFTFTWVMYLAFSTACNTVLGAYGHNYLHRLDARSMALDWNGLSAFEWTLEHVMSHHCYPNTLHDHDAISMVPWVEWIDARRSRTNATIFPLFFIGEIVVALQGYIGHRCRWRPLLRPAFPMWMRVAPLLFLMRVASHLVIQGAFMGLVTLVCSLACASFYFSYLAHLNHAPQARKTQDFLEYQLGCTSDLCTQPVINDILLGLDRQTLHHLYPTLDHSVLNDSLRLLLMQNTLHDSLWQKTFRELNDVMMQRLFDTSQS